MPGGAHEYMKAWEPEEDHIIMEMHASEGPKWKSIVKRLPGRTVSSVRNRWQRIEKGRKMREGGAELKNRCHACGQPKRGHVCYARMRGGPQVDLGGKPKPSPVLSLPPPPPPLSVPSVPELRRTRSGNRLMPVGEDESGGGYSGAPSYSGAYSSGFKVDVGAASSNGAEAPSLHRSNTSFFKDLVTSDLFSPSSRDMFASWVDSPREAPPGINQHVAMDAAAPPSLRRIASGENLEPPKMTRSVTSYVRETFGDDAPRGSPLAAPPNFPPNSAQPPPASREVSQGNLVSTSFIREFLDESADLAPPPAGHTGLSFLQDPVGPGMGDAAHSADPSSILVPPPSVGSSGAPPLLRRASSLSRMHKA